MAPSLSASTPDRPVGHARSDLIRKRINQRPSQQMFHDVTAFSSFLPPVDEAGYDCAFVGFRNTKCTLGIERSLIISDNRSDRRRGGCALLARSHSHLSQKLAAIHPFQLFLRSGLFRSDFGALMWMLFYVPNPAGDPQPFASVEYHLNPFEPSQVSLWHRLADQTHWHLTLIGVKNDVANFFEFENHYGLAEALDMMMRLVAACKSPTSCAQRNNSLISTAWATYMQLSSTYQRVVVGAQALEGHHP